MRGGGSRSSLLTASSASSRLSRLVAGRPMVRAAAATASALRPFSALLIGTAIMRRASPVKFFKKPMQSLLASIPTISTSGRDTRSSRSASAAAAARVVPAVQPELAAGRRQLDQAALRQPLQPGRPIGLCHAVIVGGWWQLELLDSAQRRDGKPRIFELVAAVKPGCRQVEQPSVVLINQPSALLGRNPILAGDFQRRVQTRRLALDRRQCVALLRSNDGRGVGLEDARLLLRDLGQRITEEVGMV